MTATNTHTSSAKKREKSPFSIHSPQVDIIFPLETRDFTSRRAFLTTLFSLPHFMEEKTEAGSRGKTAQVWPLSFCVVRVSHPLIWGSHCAPNRQEIDLHQLCSWSRADVRWCAEMMWLSRIHPVLLHPTGTPVSSFIAFISYAWWSSSLSPQILSLYHLLCAQEPPSLI